MRRVVGGVALVSLLASVVSVHIASAAQGDLDASFGVDGVATIDVGGSAEELNDLAFLSDGRVVASGTSGRVLQLDLDGSLDVDFGTGGMVTLPGGPNLSSLVIQPNGMIVVAANSSVVGRLKSDGTLDNTFGTGGTDGDGLVTVAGGYSWSKVLLQSDGRILLVGYKGRCGEGLCDGTVARLKSDGSLDNTFGVGGTDGDGLVTLSGKPLNELVIQADGRIVVAGNGLVARLTTTGTLDGTFGVGGADGDGLTTISGIGFVGGMDLSADGRIVLAGGTGSNLTVARLKSDGALDDTFGVGGTDGDGLTTVGLGPGDNFFNDVVLQTDGKLVVAGERDMVGPRLAIARVLEDGTLDTGFGTGGDDGDGWITYSGPTDADRARAVAIQANNKIVTVGQTRTSYYKLLALRIEATSTAATLAGLGVSSTSLNEAFAPSTTSYSTSVSNSVKLLTVTPTATDRNAVITVDNITTISGSASAPISLKHGANYVNLRVTAQDGLTEKIYTITVTRLNATLKVKKTMTTKKAMASVDKTVPRGAKVKITVAKASKKVCSAVAGKIRGLKKGTCTVTIAVTPKATKQVKKPKTTRSTVTITVN